MKKIFTVLTAMLFVGNIMAQTIVSTSTEKRNVVIEEFTGVNCGYCPDGHYVANQICAQYEGHAWAINIHTGGYATGSGYTTTYGDNIAGLWNIDGYPIGTVNRTTIQGRNNWAATAANIRTQDAVVNVAAQGELVGSTFTLHVEVYYTANSSQATNLLNVAVLQNNILGYQSNYGNYNPDFIEGSQYRHMHMLRDLITGQWGEEIAATEGTFIERDYTYEVGDAINGLAVPTPADLEFVVFVTEPNHKNILNGTKAVIITETPVLSRLVVEHADCALEFQPKVTVFNSTHYDFNSFTFDIDGEPYTVEQNLASMETYEFELPTVTVEVTGQPVQHCSQNMDVSLTSCIRGDGETFTVEGASVGAKYADFDIYTAAGPFTARVGVDAFASEAGVDLVKQSDCSVVWHEGGWSDVPGFNPNAIQYISQIPGARYYSITFDPSTDLYILRLTDSYGDGWAWTNNTAVSGLWLSNGEGEIMSLPMGYSNGEPFSTYDIYLNVTSNGEGGHGQVGVSEVAGVNIAVYPNPTTGILNVEAEGLREVNVMDLSGRTLMTVNDKVVNISDLSAGVYFVRVVCANGVSTQKIVKE